MTNLAMELAPESRTSGRLSAKVGDRYVPEQLHERGWQVGGEASGHILCLDRYTTGDGTSALQVFAAMQQLNTDLAGICREWQPFPQTMINVRLAKGQDWQTRSCRWPRPRLRWPVMAVWSCALRYRAGRAGHGRGGLGCRSGPGAGRRFPPKPVRAGAPAAAWTADAALLAGQPCLLSTPFALCRAFCLISVQVASL